MIVRLSVALLGVCAALYASSTAAWEMNTYADFMKGRFSGVSLTRDGRIVLAPRLQPVFSSDEPTIWSVSQAPDGSVYVGTGHRGRLYRVDKSGASTLVWTAPEPEIFAVASAADGTIFVGTSPGGKVYKIRNGSAEPYYAPDSKYIWSLATTRDGVLYVGAGDNGRIYRVTAKDTGEVWFDTGQSHVTALTLDKEGRLLGGTEPNGLIYRLDGKDKAFVLYDSNFPEIRTLTTAPDGTVYAAALGGTVQQRTNAAGAAQSGTQTAPATSPTISITVTDEGAAAQAPPELKPKNPDSAKPNTQQAAPILPGQTVYTAPTATDATGVDKSALFRIFPDNTVETLWSSKEENIYDVLLSGTQILFSTDANGRIYRMSPDHRVTLIAQTNEGETTRLLLSGDSVLAATGTMGKLYRLSESVTADGYYESPVHDAGSVARWGQLNWRGERNGRAKLAFRTRSGNSARPDRTWSDWSAPLTDPKSSNVVSPNARFIQWRAEFAGQTASSPMVSGVTLAYLPQNNPPVVRSLNVTSQVSQVTAGSKAATQPSAGTYSITVTDTGEAGPSTLSGTPSQTLNRGLSQQIQVIWQADDPDGDRLVYSIYFRGEDENEWKLLRENFNETMLTLEGDVLADGRYLFRVVASDKTSNSGNSVRQAELVSAPVLFDATPPLVTAAPPHRNGNRVQIAVRATDAASPLRRAEYSVDAATWLPLDSNDGVIDGEQESFTVNLEGLTPGEHIVVIRVYDSSGNVGLTKVVLR
jgi:outer membrane protein assembly factor BamB